MCLHFVHISNLWISRTLEINSTKNKSSTSTISYPWCVVWGCVPRTWPWSSSLLLCDLLSHHPPAGRHHGSSPDNRSHWFCSQQSTEQVFECFCPEMEEKRNDIFQCDSGDGGRGGLGGVTSHVFFFFRVSSSLMIGWQHCISQDFLLLRGGHAHKHVDWLFSQFLPLIFDDLANV